MALAAGIVAFTAITSEPTRAEITAAENEAKEAGNEYTASVESILNLGYRQGKDMSHMENDFADSH